MDKFGALSIFPIEVDRIDPHPLNPRKDLGDLTELVASIEKSGIMQNLTVVPQDDELTRFTVVIGHRRLAAAKICKLTTVPCVIAHDMDEKEQVATMIAENMQRNDLTVAEQAGAVQMMLDFGEDFESIAERTGLSESTVRRRAKIAKFDTEIVTKAMKRGATLLDFEKIADFQSEDHRKELLDAVGTANFANVLSRIKDQLKTQERLPQVIAELEELGFRPLDQLPQSTPTHWMSGIWDVKKKEIDVIKNFQSVRKKQPNDAVFYYQVKAEYGSPHFDLYYTSKEEDAEDNERRERDRAAYDKRNAAEAIFDRFSDMWTAHILSVVENNKRSVSFTESILLDLAFDVIHSDYRIDWATKTQFDSYDTSDKTTEIRIYFFIASQLVKIGAPVEWQTGEYKKKQMIEPLFQLLEEDGYQVSDEERAFFDGSHEIWKGAQAE